MSRVASSADEQQQLRADLVGDRVVDRLAEEDDPLAQQPVVDRVVERSCRRPALRISVDAQRLRVEASSRRGPSLRCGGSDRLSDADGNRALTGSEPA